MGRSRTNKRSSNRRQTSKYNRNASEDEAGQAIAAGGYGCVFKPAIECRDSKINDKMQETGYEYITKVMFAGDARTEMAEVEQVLPITKKIPNEKRYFLLDGIFACKKFGPLSAEDLKDFDTKCVNFERDGITTSNINKPFTLRGLSAIYIPFGGDSVASTITGLANQYINNPSSNAVKNKIGLIVWGLSDVLENAVVPMNKLGLIHLDLKGDNMLINKNALEENKMPYVKIIDWGLAGIVPSSGISPEAKDKPLQFNVPFSNILFNKRLVENVIRGDCYSDEISSAQINTIATQIVVKMVKEWSGHAEYISQNLQQYLGPHTKASGTIHELDSKAECTTVTITVIVEYISAVIRKYLKKNDSNGLYQCVFNSDAYFQEVYRYNCDVWGLLTAFQNFIEVYTSYSKFREDILARTMSNIMFKYCFSPTYAAERIPVGEVIEDMHKLAGLCGINRMPATENATVARPTPPNVAPSVSKLQRKNTKIVLRQTTVSRGSTISLKERRRCPNGYLKHPSKPGKCRKTVNKSTNSRQTSQTRKTATPQQLTLPPGRRRCPNGYSRVSGDGLTTRIICAKN